MSIPFDVLLSFDMFISAMFRLLLSNLINLIVGLVAKQRIELNPGHIGLRDVGDVASAALADRRFRRRLLVRHWVMAKGEKSPSVGLGKSLAVLHRHVDPVELAVEEPASGWFFARSVRKRRIEHAGQLLH